MSIVYNRQELMSLRHKPNLPVLSSLTIFRLNINNINDQNKSTRKRNRKTRRGTKGGRRRKNKHCCDVINTQDNLITDVHTELRSNNDNQKYDHTLPPFSTARLDKTHYEVDTNISIQNNIVGVLCPIDNIHGEEQPINVIIGNRPIQKIDHPQGQTTTPTHHTTISSKSRPPKRKKPNLIPISMKTHEMKVPSNVLYFNAQSARNKSILIHDLVTEHQPQLLFITESWLRKKGDETIIKEMKPPSYELIPFPRPCGRGGGGICVLYKEKLPIKSQRINLTTSTECVNVTVFNCTFICVYHPPPNSRNTSTHRQFLLDMEEILESHYDRNGRLVILGDFNLHFDAPQDFYTNAMINILSQFNLQQLVKTATQREGHTLDWIVTNQTDLHPLENLTIRNNHISDHYLLAFTIQNIMSQNTTRIVTSRNVKAIDIDAFKDTIMDNLSTPQPDLTLAENLNDGLLRALDQHAPLTTRTVRERISAPWYTPKVKQAKQQRRSAERKWRKTNLTIDKQIYQQSIKNVKNVITQEKSIYYSAKIISCKNSKMLHEIVNELKGNMKTPTIPSNIPLTELPNVFGTFFQDKIKNIRTLIANYDCNVEPLSADVLYNGPLLDSFQPVTPSEIIEIISSSPSKSCPLDPIPTHLFIDCLDIVIDYVTEIINHSLEFGNVPRCYKKAMVTPLLKKHDLDRDDLKHYRPVSNLPYLSKILEKVVLKQLKNHLYTNDLLEPFQSAYRENHSTETALLKILNDILMACDEGKVSVLVLLDLSAAFDTIDHTILCDRLSRCFGISGVVLDWIKSYLHERRLTVAVNGLSSDEFDLNHGVPQGSVLGPTLYILYTLPVSSIIKPHISNYHFFADDTQLYESAFPDDLPVIATHIERCCGSLKLWMYSNQLKLNENKTDIILCTSDNRMKDIEVSGLVIDNVHINFSPSARNLGIILDSNLSLEVHICNLIKTINFELHRIARIKPYIPSFCLKTLVSTLILSRLDYCNSLYFGLPDKNMNKLQKLQNRAARLVLGKSYHDDPNEMLITLHWLPVKARIDFKIALLCFKSLNSFAPSYISDLVIPYQPIRSLRSQASGSLVVPRTKLKHFGDRAFARAGPVVWNSLPEELRLLNRIDAFKRNLKTFLFQKYLL